MKIKNIKLDVFEWKGTPWKTNYRNIFGQNVNLSVLSIETDEGITGISKSQRNGALSRNEHRNFG